MHNLVEIPSQVRYFCFIHNSYETCDYIMDSAKRATKAATVDGSLIPPLTMANRTDGTITCPKSGERLIPIKTWKGAQGIEYGIFKKHHHRGEECEHSGLVERLNQAQEQPPFTYGYI